jgi:hypothetical protein
MRASFNRCCARRSVSTFKRSIDGSGTEVFQSLVHETALFNRILFAVSSSSTTFFQSLEREMALGNISRSFMVDVNDKAFNRWNARRPDGTPIRVSWADEIRDRFSIAATREKLLLLSASSSPFSIDIDLSIARMRESLLQLL